MSEGFESTALREDLILGRLELADCSIHRPARVSNVVRCSGGTGVVRAANAPASFAEAARGRRPDGLSGHGASRPNAIRMLIDTACRSAASNLTSWPRWIRSKSLLQPAVDGQGYAIVPESAARTVVTRWGISAIDRPVIRNDMVLAYSRQRLLSRLGASHVRFGR